MADDWRTEVVGDGSTVITINGKPFTLEHGYRSTTVDGWFFLIVSGKQTLFWDDLGEYWSVMGKGGRYFAYAQRPFSYHLCDGDEAEIPLGVDWPRLKNSHGWFAVVGPNAQSVETQVELLLDQYRPSKTVDDIRHYKIKDVTGKGADAWLIEM